MDANKTALVGIKGQTLKIMEVKRRHKKTKVTKSSKDFACKNLLFMDFFVPVQAGFKAKLFRAKFACKSFFMGFLVPFQT